MRAGGDAGGEVGAGARAGPGVRRALPAALVLALAVAACQPGSRFDATTDYVVVGVHVWDGTGAPPSELAVVQISQGRILSIDPIFDGVDVSAEFVDTTSVLAGIATESSEAGIPGAMPMMGGYLIPGLINTHGHVGGTWNPGTGVEYGDYAAAELERYARFGVTTVNSLGGDREASLALRDGSWEEDTGAEDSADAGADADTDTGGSARARLLVAGPVVIGATPAEATAAVDAAAAMGPDWIKIRVDDNLGATTKMSPETYAAVIARARDHNLPVASHLFYQEDAKGLLRAGTGMVAHSIRDEAVDDETIGLFRETGVCYVPTLTREVSTFAYGDRPDFFDDPFLMSDVDSAQVMTVSDPERRARVRASGAAEAYGRALETAQANLARLSEAGVPIAFGTDSGPLGRFQGYFEHMEMQLMAEAGLTSEQILRSATGVAAACLGRTDIGTLEPGRRADFIILRANPLVDLANMRAIEGVWVGGERVEGLVRF